jgi:drug/metabolite transporter (DMT)-like permease
MPLATATVLFFSAPIFATILAIPVLGERPGPRRIAAVAAGFVGVMIVLRPGAVPLTWAMGAALGSSMCFAIVLLMSRKMANEDGPLATYVSSAVMTFLISLPIVGTAWEVPYSTVGWVALGILVVSSMVRNIADIQAYRMAEASFLAPLAYTRLVFIAVGAYILFDETPDTAALIGGIVIMGAALYIARRERSKRREAARAAKT